MPIQFPFTRRTNARNVVVYVNDHSQRALVAFHGTAKGNIAVKGQAVNADHIRKAAKEVAGGYDWECICCYPGRVQKHHPSLPLMAAWDGVTDIEETNKTVSFTASGKARQCGVLLIEEQKA